MKRKNRLLVIFIAVLTTLAAVGGVMAYMFKKSNEIKNILDAPVVEGQVLETFDAATGMKSSIRLKNTGNIDAYLRLKLVSYWTDDDGHVLGVPSEMPAVSFDSASWVAGSGDTYYHKNAVAPASQTSEFLSSSMTLTSKSVTIDGETKTAHQVVVVLLEALQAQPAGAAQDAWGVTVSDGVITAAP